MSPRHRTCTRPAAVACVVVAYHRPERLRLLLDALVPREGGIETAVDLVVVNVEDDPGVAAIAGRAAVVGVRGNPGYAAAVNAGAAATDAPVVVFMNDDVECPATAVRVLAAAVTAGADVAVPRVLDGNGRPERTIAALPSAGALLKEWALLPDHPIRGLEGRVAIEKWRLPAAPERVEAASAPVVAVRRSVLTDVPLPEEYFLYWEESEWFFRLRALGARVEYRPDAVVVHRGGRDDVRPDKARLLARNAVRCVRRTGGRRQAALAYPIVVAWWTRLWLTDALRTLGGRGRPGSLAARAAGLAAALRAWREVLR